MNDQLNLKEAQKDTEKLKKFVKEHEQDFPGDEDRMDAFISSAVRDKPKSILETFSEDFDEN